MSNWSFNCFSKIVLLQTMSTILKSNNSVKKEKKKKTLTLMKCQLQTTLVSDFLGRTKGDHFIQIIPLCFFILFLDREMNKKTQFSVAKQQHF